MNESVLVTGGCGYIGGLLVRRLVATGTRVAVVDNHTGPVRACAGFLGEKHPARDLRGGDLRSVVGDCGVIVHLASASGVERVAKDPAMAAGTNVVATEDLCWTARELGVPLIFASSFAVVGRLEGATATETTEARPISLYARQKALGEGIVRRALGNGGPGGAIVRMTNVYGRYRLADDRPSRDGLPVRTVTKGTLVDKFHDLAVSNLNLPIYGTGEQVRNYLHIGDAVESWVAAVRIVARRERSLAVPTYLLAGPDDLSVRSVAREVLSATGSESELFNTGNPRTGEVDEESLSIDNSATLAALGVRPGTTVRSYLRGLGGRASV